MLGTVAKLAHVAVSGDWLWSTFIRNLSIRRDTGLTDHELNGS